jgi:two-component system phosphate regulon sensor histidine kinase PhoR
MQTAAREQPRLRHLVGWALLRRSAGPADLAKRRVQVALLVLLALLAAVLAAGILSAFSLYRSAENRYIHLVFPLQTSVRDLELGMVQQETGVRGYMITHDYRTSLVTYFEGNAAVKRDLRQISKLSRNEPQLSAQLPRMRVAIVRLQGLYDKLITFTRDGRLGQQRARSEVLVADGLFASFQRTANRVQQDVNALAQTTRQAQHTTFIRSVGTLVVAGFLGLVIAATLLVSVPRRLRELYLAEETARQRVEQGANSARALAHVSDAVVLVDDGGRVRSWNPAAERHFGVDSKLALGRPAQEVVPEYARLLGSKDQFVPADVDGEQRWFTATQSTFDGGHVLTVRDVTAGHALERARSEFVATASHELRTPLTSIYGAAQTLLGRGDLPEQRRVDLMRIIEQESTQLARVVDQLLLSARLDRGTLTQAPVPCDLRALCESVLTAAETRKPPEVTLAFFAPPALRQLSCDEGLLRQVLSNLVDNALKYSPQGGRIELRVVDEPHRVRVSVHDEGLGIPVSEQERIFDKFYRLDADMSRGVGGSGLGLHIARELVEHMEGTISVESVPGAGSTFTVTLPRATAA